MRQQALPDRAEASFLQFGDELLALRRSASGRARLFPQVQGLGGDAKSLPIAMPPARFRVVTSWAVLAYRPATQHRH